MEFTQWTGFTTSAWQTEINVRDFIQKNYTPYYGDASFLGGATERTKDLLEQFRVLQKKEQENGGVLDIDTTTVSSLLAV